MSKLFLTWHLGLGDHLITNAIVRDRAAKHEEVLIPVKHRNVATVKFMFRDLPNVTITPISDDYEMVAKSLEFKNGEVLSLGMFGKNYDHGKGDWDRQMYQQAEVPFEQRWVGFKVLRDPDKETPCRPGLIFLHEDEKRGYVIDRSKVPNDMIVIQPFHTDTIFNWWDVIKNAEEIHCIDSSFAIFVDSIPIAAKRLVLHLYARPGARPPSYRKGWEILK